MVMHKKFCPVSSIVKLEKIDFVSIVKLAMHSFGLFKKNKCVSSKAKNYVERKGFYICLSNKA